MIIEKDDEKSSGTAVLKKRYATTFEGAHIQTLILGDGVFERVDKLPEDVLYLNREKAGARKETVKDEFIITREKIGRCILAVQKYFWGSSCYAILYCVLRDRCNHDPGMRGLESEIRSLSVEYHFDYICSTNTIASTICHNRFMKLDIDKWEKQRINPRYITLVRKFIDAFNEIN